MHQRMAYVVNCHVPQKYSMTALLCFSPQFASKVTFLHAGLLRSSSAPVDCHVFWSSRPLAWREAKFLSECLFPWPFAKWVDVGSLARAPTDPEKEEEEEVSVIKHDYMEISNEIFNDSCATALSAMKDVT